ncbi:MAG: hypothetical protein ACQESK_05565 [Bacteroidota bacterium]
MIKKIFLICFLAVTICNAQNDSKNEEPSYRLNSSFGLSFSSDWIINKPSLFVKTGFGFKMNEHFWLNADIFGMRYGSDRYGGFNETHYTNWTFAPNISKDFNIGKKFKIVGFIGLFVAYENVSSEDFRDGQPNDITGETPRIKYFYETNTVDVGAILGMKLLYEVKENLLVGIDFTSYAYLYLYLDNFLLGPSIEFRL